MARFFMAGTNIHGGRAIIKGRDAEHVQVLRLRPGPAEGCRLAADETLERVAAWARGQKPSLGEGLRALELRHVAGPALDRAPGNGREDRQITFKLVYEEFD